jgi:2-keto-4-pentenoate hydratase/2-oxohepta-3-ene-1,7-dioic acid hydratase in catechol pathway
LKWATFEHGGIQYVGSVRGESIEVYGEASALLSLIGNSPGTGIAPARTGTTFTLSEVELCAPVPKPPSVRDFVAFEEHLTNGAGGQSPPAVWYELPVFYFSNPAAICGPTADVAISPGSRAFDYELEVAAVIGKTGSNLSVEDAADCICGYTIMCDFSARDLQARESKLGLGPSKGKDGATSLGPFLVTPDELAAYRTDRGFGLEMTASVNGREYSRGRLDAMYWSFEQLVAYASRGTTLVPGDVIGCGTVGTGCILEHRMMGKKADYPWLREGDQLELCVAGIGVLSHHIVAAPPVKPLARDAEPLTRS